MAVGEGDDEPVPYGGSTGVIERWDGSSWEVQQTLPASSGLSSVSCVSSTACTAVGRGGSSGYLAERWDGTSWSEQPTPGPNPLSIIFPRAFSDVDCSSDAACMAVGSAGVEESADVPWAEQYR
jgi:hypothetical protein